MSEKKPTNSKTLIERPPVIAVMGHIDHGKSTLLDYIRRTNTTDREAGGITQHVAAYEVTHKDKAGKERHITFLDTPGHAAFEGIRIRGANIADIAILVVSGEEGVKPQTLEALKHIKEAKTPFLVAINKMDSPKADLERTKGNMAEHEIYIEGYGGDTPWVAVSAKTGEGIPELLDTVLLIADLEELTADASVPAEGFVIEANRDSKKGVSATLIIKNGSLSKGMAVLAGDAIAPVRIMEDTNGKAINEAHFSSPIKLIGFSTLPKVGDTFSSFANKKDAEKAQEVARQMTNNAPKKAVSSSSAPAPVAGEEPRVFIPLVLKADVSGTLEAIEHELKKLKQDKVGLKIIQAGIGDITENDAKAAASNLKSDDPNKPKVMILGFNTRIDPLAKAAADRGGVAIETFDIIYKLIERVEAVMVEKTPKTQSEELTGSAKILKTFSKTRDKQVLGGRVLDGLISIGDEVRILRRDALVGMGRLRELQQQKQKATQAHKDTEFGAMIESKTEIAAGDVIEAITLVTK